jgi:hypothetical protein
MHSFDRFIQSFVNLHPSAGATISPAFSFPPSRRERERGEIILLVPFLTSPRTRQNQTMGVMMTPDFIGERIDADV